MRVLLTGSTGLIGSAIAARLLMDGHEVTGVGRRGGPQPGMRWTTLDIRSASRPDDWLPLLNGIDAVINCIGVLQASTLDSTQAAHADGPAALFAACEQAGVSRVIHGIEAP